jgi:hypothetical protein
MGFVSFFLGRVFLVSELESSLLDWMIILSSNLVSKLGD